MTDAEKMVMRSYWADAIRRFRRHRVAIIGVCVIAVFVLLAITAPVVAPYTYQQGRFERVAGIGTPGHLLGTDDLGRDVLSRMIYGARISLTIGLVSQLMVLVISLVLGCTAGYFGGRVDNVIMRFTDVMFAVPPLLLALMLMAVFGRGISTLFIVIGLVSWPGTTRLVRGQVLTVKEEEFVEAARALGAPAPRIIIRHVIPSILSPLIVQVTFGIPAAIMSEAFLSFIGIGAPPPLPSWGLMMADGFRWIRVSPHLALIPAASLSLLLIAFNFVGDGLRDALDPKMKH